MKHLQTYENHNNIRLEVGNIDYQFCENAFVDMGFPRNRYSDTHAWIKEDICAMLYDDNRPIGCYLLGKYTLFDVLDAYIAADAKITYYEDLSYYKDKDSIYGILLYLLPEYRNSGYGKKLIDHSYSVGGDYIFGFHDEMLDNIEHWKKRRRVAGKNFYDGTDSYFTIADI